MKKNLNMFCEVSERTEKACSENCPFLYDEYNFKEDDQETKCFLFGELTHIDCSTPKRSYNYTSRLPKRHENCLRLTRNVK